MPCCLCRGGLRTVMITGDYHHTAVAVARSVGMVQPDGRVVVIDTAHTEVLHDDQSVAQRPDAGSSAAGSPLSMPQVSFRRRDADFAHGFFVQSSKPGPEVSVSKALPAKRASNERAQPSRLSWEAHQPSRLSWEEQRPSRLSLEGLTKNDLPLKAAPTPKQPIEAANVHMLPVEAASAERPPNIRLSFEGMPSANKAAAANRIRLPPIKAAHSQGQGPIQAAHSKPPVPIEASLHGSPSRRQLVKAASLTSLPTVRLQFPWQLHLLSHLVNTPPQANLLHRAWQSLVTRCSRFRRLESPVSLPTHGSLQTAPCLTPITHRGQP